MYHNGQIWGACQVHSQDATVKTYPVQMSLWKTQRLGGDSFFHEVARRHCPVWIALDFEMENVNKTDYCNIFCVCGLYALIGQHCGFVFVPRTVTDTMRVLLFCSMVLCWMVANISWWEHEENTQYISIIPLWISGIPDRLSFWGKGYRECDVVAGLGRLFQNRS